MRLRMTCRRADRVRTGGARASACLAARHLDFVRHGVVVHKRVRLQPAHGHRADGRRLEQRARHAVAQGLWEAREVSACDCGLSRAWKQARTRPRRRESGTIVRRDITSGGGCPAELRRGRGSLSSLASPAGCRCPLLLLQSAWLSPPRCGQACLLQQGSPCSPNAARTSATGWCPSPTRCWPSPWPPRPWTGRSPWRRWGRQTQQPRRVWLLLLVARV
jgi:hypothetical protein